MGPTIIDEGQPIEPIGLRLTRAFDSGVRARTNFRRTLPGEGDIQECEARPVLPKAPLVLAKALKPRLV
jgi:hypothetical protein